jgi:hypothetical protein
LATQVEDPATLPSMAASPGPALRIARGGAQEEEKAAAREETVAAIRFFFRFYFFTEVAGFKPVLSGVGRAEVAR